MVSSAAIVVSALEVVPPVPAAVISLLAEGISGDDASVSVPAELEVVWSVPKPAPPVPALDSPVVTPPVGAVVATAVLTPAVGPAVVVP